MRADNWHSKPSGGISREQPSDEVFDRLAYELWRSIVGGQDLLVERRCLLVLEG